MTKNELQKILDERHVPKIMYSLDGLKNGDCLCVVNNNGNWKIMQNDRGTIGYVEECSNEQDAYDRFYQIVKNDYGWKD